VEDEGTRVDSKPTLRCFDSLWTAVGVHVLQAVRLIDQSKIMEFGLEPLAQSRSPCSQRNILLVSTSTWYYRMCGFDTLKQYCDNSLRHLAKPSPKFFGVKSAKYYFDFRHQRLDALWLRSGATYRKSRTPT